MKYRLIACLSLLFCGVLSAQNFNDALRYSFISPQGSARFAGTGGSLTPLGTDITTLHTNPAGIGWNRFNLVQVTPGFSLIRTDGELEGAFGGTSLSESSANVNIASAGAVFAGTTRSVNFSTLNFGISLSRMADFNQQYRFNGRSEGSILDAFISDYNNDVGDPFGSNLLFEIDTLYLDDQGFFSEFDFVENEGAQIQRSGLVDRRGGMSEVALGFGGNYREKLLWGLSIGIPFLNYEEDYTYDEVDDLNEVTRFESSSFDQNLTAKGTGFNLKLGLIYLPTEELRLSAAVHTPTYWAIDERFVTTFAYNFELDNQALGGSALSPLSEYTYNLSTPWRFGLGAGYTVGNRGFISVDADYVNYTGNTISFDDFSGSDETTQRINQEIDDVLSSGIGVRVGGEVNLKPLQLRAGVGYRQVPFATYLNDEDETLMSYSAGVGYSVGKFFVDLAGQYEGGYGSFRNAYESNTFAGQTILTDRSRVSVLLTVGFRGWNAGF